MTRTVLIITLLLFIPVPSSADEFTANVTKVIDGDTFDFEAEILNVKVLGRCRMLSYNAPEIRGKERPEGLDAKEYLKTLIYMKSIRIQAEETDKYGRWLCEVWRGGEPVNEMMRKYLKDYPGRDKY